MQVFKGIVEPNRKRIEVVKMISNDLRDKGHLEVNDGARGNHTGALSKKCTMKPHVGVGGGL